MAPHRVFIIYVIPDSLGSGSIVCNFRVEYNGGPAQWDDIATRIFFYHLSYPAQYEERWLW